MLCAPWFVNHGCPGPVDILPLPVWSGKQLREPAPGALVKSWAPPQTS